MFEHIAYEILEIVAVMCWVFVGSYFGFRLGMFVLNSMVRTFVLVWLFSFGLYYLVQAQQFLPLTTNGLYEQWEGYMKYGLFFVAPAITMFLQDGMSGRASILTTCVIIVIIQVGMVTINVLSPYYSTLPMDSFRPLEATSTAVASFWMLTLWSVLGFVSAVGILLGEFMNERNRNVH